MESLGDYASNDVFGGILAQVGDQGDGVRGDVSGDVGGKIHLLEMRNQLVLEDGSTKRDPQTDTAGSQESVHDRSMSDFLAVCPNLNGVVQGHKEKTVSDAGGDEDKNPAVVVGVDIEQDHQTSREGRHSPARPDGPTELSKSAHDRARDDAHGNQGASCWDESQTGLSRPKSLDGFEVDGEVVK